MAFAISQMLVGATLLQSLAFAAFLLTDRFRAALANRFLLAALCLMAAIKLDELYQLVGGLASHPEWGFVLAPLQPLMTPALYFFIRARTDANFALRAGHAWHLLPFALYAAFLSATFFSLDIEAKRRFLEGAALSSPIFALLIPAASDLLQLAYLGAALALLSRHGLALREWFSRVDDKNLGWMRPILVLWAVTILIHLGRTIAVGAFGERGADIVAIVALDAGHFFLINVLLLSAIADFAARPAPAAPGKYAASSQSPAERRVLFGKAEAILAARGLHLDPDLTLQDLADALAATPRELSEAINGEGGEPFYAFVNRRRIDHAKARLAEEPGARILDVALASGFNSKSTFNETFRRYAGETPSAWRAKAASPTATAASPATKG